MRPDFTVEITVKRAAVVSGTSEEAGQYVARFHQILGCAPVGLAGGVEHSRLKSVGE